MKSIVWARLFHAKCGKRMLVCVHELVKWSLHQPDGPIWMSPMWPMAPFQMMPMGPWCPLALPDEPDGPNGSHGVGRVGPMMTSAAIAWAWRAAWWPMGPMRPIM